MTYISVSFGEARNRQAFPMKHKKTAKVRVQKLPNLSKTAPKTIVPNDVRLDPMAKIELSSAFCSASVLPSLFLTY